MPAGALRPKLRAQDSSRNKNRRPEARQAVGLPESTRIQRLGTVGIIVVTACPWLSAPKTLQCTCEACCRKTINCCTLLRPLCSDAATSFDRHIIQRILESEQERCRKDRLCDLGSNTYTHKFTRQYSRASPNHRLPPDMNSPPYRPAVPSSW